MKGQSKVHTWELLLRVEVRAASDDPPAILVGMDVPHVMAGAPDGLRVDLLHESHFEVGRLPLEIFSDFLDFLFGSFQHDQLPQWLTAPRQKGLVKASTIIESLSFRHLA